MMSMAGAPYALYSSYIDPPGVFSMQYSLATLAMPLLGGTSTWVGPVIGAIVLSIVQQVLAVYASSHVNLLVLGLILIVSVILLPKGISGAWRPRRRLA